jgi:putative ABC transport system permease protein
MIVGFRNNVAVKLLLAQARRSIGRFTLAIAAIVVAACVVIWVVSSYDSLLNQFDEFSEQYLGRYQLIAVPRMTAPTTSFSPPPIPLLANSMVDLLRQESDIAMVDPVFQSPIQVEKAAVEAGVAKIKSDEMPMLVGSDTSQPPYPMAEGKWIDSQHPDRLEAAISRGAAEKLKVKLNDELVISKRGGTAKCQVRIVGIVEQVTSLPPINLDGAMPSMRETVLKRGPADAALYVPWKLAEKIAGQPAEISFAGIVLNPGMQIDDFRRRFQQRHAALAEQVELQTADEIGGELQASSTTQAAQTQAYSATGISLLAALFIIFSTLSMGVHERTRQFAVLRAVALTRFQIGAMIMLESLALGAIGWIGGICAGWGLLKIVSGIRPDLFPGGISLGLWCLLLSAACVFGGSLLAAVIPAWNAASIAPLDAMSPRSNTPSRRQNTAITLAGIALIAINPILMFVVPISEGARYAVFAAGSCVTTAIGFLLLAPATIRLAERCFAPLLSWLLRLNPRLLRTQLSSNLWRSLGASISLTLGLGIFVAMQVWGYSMLAPFMPGKWTPDLLVMIAPGGVRDSQCEAISQTDGIVQQECLPLAVEQVKFADDLTGAKVRTSVTRQDNCILIGIDPQRALSGDEPMMKFCFVAGDRKAVVEKLTHGRYCIIPDHFQRESGLGIGDSLAVIPPESPDQIVRYEIVGVVSMEGWHLLSKGGLRTRSPRSAAMVFAPLEVVHMDFGLERIGFFFMNKDGSAEDSQIQASLQAIVDQDREAGNSADAKSPRGGRTPKVRLQSTEALCVTIQKHADRIIWGLSKLPLVTLLVTSLGIVSAVLSSIRTRRWQLGVMRAMGMTRFGLIRLIVAESLLVGCSACLLSLGFGIAVGYCGTEVTRYVNVHGGLVTPLTIPWAKIAFGFALTLLLCVLAAIAPAIVTARAEPLRLLQGGRHSN